MNSVPLHCHICPKQPDFSDVSHLLTHIGSKGHLSNYFKAQVRSNQDASVRQQLDVYERWYAEHQIEKLLSQRMVLKDSKKANGVARANKQEKSASTKPTKSLQTASKKGAPTKRQGVPVRAETQNAIDPRLSQPTASISQSANSLHPHSPSSSPGFDITSIRHGPPGPYPPMHSFYAPTKRRSAATIAGQQLHDGSMHDKQDIEGQMVDSDTESEDEPPTRQSVEPLYPEPPNMKAIDAPLETLEISKPCKTSRGRPRRIKSYEDTCETEEIVTPRTPELKGIFYPGMSLFDSASAEAQKKRNQRKNESILAQIQQESLEVECNEYIYWPDGSLKMCRFITGDVQSSPFKDDTTPPPPPPKRRRGRKPKNATSEARQGRPKEANQPPTTHNNSPYGALLNQPDVAAMTPNAHGLMSPSFGNAMAYNNTKFGDEDWLLDPDQPTQGSHQKISIFSDPPMPSPRMTGSPVKLHPNPLNLSTSPHKFHSPDYAHIPWLMSGDRLKDARQLSNAVSEGISSSFSGHKVGMAGRSILGALQPRQVNRSVGTSQQDRASDRHTHSDAQSLTRDSPTHEAFLQVKPMTGLSGSAYPRFGLGKENLPPPGAGSVETVGRMSYAGHPAEVQKYFMVKGNQRAEISTTLPPEMAFGGMKSPPVYRASLNPLNPNAHLRQSLPYSSNYTRFRSGYADTASGYRNSATILRGGSKMENDGNNNPGFDIT
ncbi:MAG: hypothetical protein LQ337_003427 [Flavoplaca oasis]|nr:MAG: hypothetical protein LQ337_003427 [Flavoplaca oasis]